MMNVYLSFNWDIEDIIQAVNDMHYLDAKYDAVVVVPLVANPGLYQYTPQDTAFVISKSTLFICNLIFKSLILYKGFNFTYAFL